MVVSPAASPKSTPKSALGRVTLPVPPPADRVFFQGFQTGATVAVRDVRLTRQ
jgi:hypothetical protein